MILISCAGVASRESEEELLMPGIDLICSVIVIFIMIFVVIIENGDDLSVHDINIGFVKQLLMRGIPVLYEEILSQLLNNQVVPNLEVMMTHAVYYWCNEHREKLTLSDAELGSLQKLQHAGGDVSMLQKEVIQFVSV
ncbi:unnamed protein product [Cylicostephanus goldi]|uniref:Uncharacterized protein n=1 Tax=Cylicostephanus goldi TaxID=71465 RepID=A0A3P6R3L5_CYLGO|nr:unnamed protein product [Cylicostephanus goldi]